MNIIESSQLPENEEVYLKKSLGEWRVVHPYRDKNKNLIWMNFLFGGRWNLIVLIFILVLLGMGYLGVNELISNYKAIADNPCSFCYSCQDYTRDYVNQYYNYEDKSIVNLSALQ